MAQDGKDGDKEDAGKTQDSKLEADLTDEELKAVVGGAATKIGLNGTGVLYRK